MNNTPESMRPNCRGTVDPDSWVRGQAPGPLADGRRRAAWKLPLFILLLFASASLGCGGGTALLETPTSTVKVTPTAASDPQADRLLKSSDPMDASVIRVIEEAQSAHPCDLTPWDSECVEDYQREKLAGADQVVMEDSDTVTVAALTSRLQQLLPSVVRVSTGNSAGTGVIAHTRGNIGYVVTNHHVVEDASSVEVTVGQTNRYNGEILGFDQVRDLAVLKICCGEFMPARFGDVTSVGPGTEVIAIGFARDIPGSPSLSRGIISAMRYDPGVQSEVIQTDAAINPGNSGGPLASLGGEVLGLVTFKFDQAEGLGFAISSDAVLQQMPALWGGEADVPAVPAQVPVVDPALSDDELEARIREALEEIVPIPTPAASLAPVPVPNAQPIPSISPTLTEIPLSHPCALETIESAEDMAITYEKFLAAEGMVNYSPLAQEALRIRVVDAAGSYTIAFLNDPMAYNSFRDYLIAIGIEGAIGLDSKSQLESLRRRGLLPERRTSLVEYGEARASDPCTAARIRVFTDDDVMTLLALSVNGGGINRYASDAVLTSLVRFRFHDPSAPLIYWILENQVN